MAQAIKSPFFKMPGYCKIGHNGRAKNREQRAGNEGCKNALRYFAFKRIFFYAHILMFFCQAIIATIIGTNNIIMGFISGKLSCCDTIPAQTVQVKI